MQTLLHCLLIRFDALQCADEILATPPSVTLTAGNSPNCPARLQFNRCMQFQLRSIVKTISFSLLMITISALLLYLNNDFLRRFIFLYKLWFIVAQIKQIC